VGVRTAEYPTVQKPGQVNIRRIAGLAGDLVGAVVADGASAHHLVLLGGQDDVGLVIEHIFLHLRIGDFVGYIIEDIIPYQEKCVVDFR
jgi:hypothetical protein